MRKLSRRQFVASTALAARAADRRPNILFLMPDQHRYHAVGCLGNPEVKTPHLDRLAGEGVTLHHTFANTPVCCPARAVLLTGQYCHRNGMMANDLRLREGGVSLAQILAGAGYRTGFVGKWHLDGGQREPGWVPPGARRQGFEFWAAHQCSHRHFENHYFRDDPKPIHFGKFEAEGWADVAVEFLEQTRSDKRPFYLTVQWGPPHDPYKAPISYAKPYKNASLSMRPNYRPGKGRVPVPTPDAIAEYYGMVTAIDDQVGRLMAKLDELGLRENTIVLYSSDHGDMLGSQGERLKRKPWEESIRVPGFLRWPGKIQPGTHSDTFFTHVDFAPTLLGMAGIGAPKAMQGRDLSKVIVEGKGKGPDSAFFQIFGPFAGDGTDGGWRGVRTARYMYARYEDKPWCLYDLQEDPHQLHNLAGKPEAARIQAALERRLARWMKETGDSWSFNWKHAVEDAGRLYKHKTFYSVGEYLEWAKHHPELDRA
jgi:arylsulfatase A-like enzyme